MRKSIRPANDTVVRCCGQSQSINLGRASIHGYPKCSECGRTMRPAITAEALRRAMGE